MPPKMDCELQCRLKYARPVRSNRPKEQMVKFKASKGEKRWGDGIGNARFSHMMPFHMTWGVSIIMIIESLYHPKSVTKYLPEKTMKDSGERTRSNNKEHETKHNKRRTSYTASMIYGREIQGSIRYPS
jgi:hypothetical protein